METLLLMLIVLQQPQYLNIEEIFDLIEIIVSEISQIYRPYVL